MTLMKLVKKTRKRLFLALLRHFFHKSELIRSLEYTENYYTIIACFLNENAFWYTIENCDQNGWFHLICNIISFYQLYRFQFPLIQKCLKRLFNGHFAIFLNLKVRYDTYDTAEKKFKTNVLGAFTKSFKLISIIREFWLISITSWKRLFLALLRPLISI